MKKSVALLLTLAMAVSMVACGAKTEEAVVQFQGMFNLTTDGVVGRYTWTAINEALLGNILPNNDEEYT